MFSSGTDTARRKRRALDGTLRGGRHSLSRVSSLDEGGGREGARVALLRGIDGTAEIVVQAVIGVSARRFDMSSRASAWRIGRRTRGGEFLCGGRRRRRRPSGRHACDGCSQRVDEWRGRRWDASFTRGCATRQFPNEISSPLHRMISNLSVIGIKANAPLDKALGAAKRLRIPIHQLEVQNRRLRSRLRRQQLHLRCPERPAEVHNALLVPTLGAHPPRRTRLRDLLDAPRLGRPAHGLPERAEVRVERALRDGGEVVVGVRVRVRHARLLDDAPLHGLRAPRPPPAVVVVDVVTAFDVDGPRDGTARALADAVATLVVLGVIALAVVLVAFRVADATSLAFMMMMVVVDAYVVAVDLVVA
jgi:hypothetical protein